MNDRNATLPRCAWCGTDELYRDYHDREWGVPVRDDDRLLFEFLVLEGAQAGLSWITVLRKRERYREVFGRFDPAFVAALTDADVDRLLTDPGIIRNRLKVESARSNARAFLDVQAEFGTFSRYLWSFTDGERVVNEWRDLGDVPARTELSDRLSRDLRQRGFRFVGSTICYAYLQAVGVVMDHVVHCFRYAELS
ncbi:MAG TPA: DNA-3-methyladenine glycosylase I [Gammaproteobacteria bacterium]|nr:DNA-3-methyladenine glycosylase I [Gammaproteobacteria bacterium]